MEAAVRAMQLQSRGVISLQKLKRGGTGSPHDLPDDTWTLALEMDLKLGVSGTI